MPEGFEVRFVNDDEHTELLRCELGHSKQKKKKLTWEGVRMDSMKSNISGTRILKSFGIRLRGGSDSIGIKPLLAQG